MGEAFFYAVLLGAALGFLYDFFRLPRLVFNDKFFFDFLFWIISAIAVYCYYLIFNSGAIRIIYFLLIFIGFLLYTFTLGYVTKSLEIKLSKKIKKQLRKMKNVSKSFKKVLQSKRKVYYNIFTRKRKSNDPVTDEQLSAGSTGDSDGSQSEKEE